jgi:hypothetical protein
MNTYFHHIILCTALLLPLTPLHAQNNPSPAEQKQQEPIEPQRLKMMADTLRQDTALSKEEQNYLFRLSMRKMMMERMRQSGKKMWEWEPTEWQKSLPALTIQDKGVTMSYSFTDLINADGFLCPGSARAYKALQVALPILYKNSTPIKGDFKITHGAAMCTSLVYDFFMEGDTEKAGKKLLELDISLKEKLISVQRLSTGKKVTIAFPFSSIQGHDQTAAEAGNVILHAKEGQGMTVYVEEE